MSKTAQARRFLFAFFTQGILRFLLTIVLAMVCVSVCDAQPPETVLGTPNIWVGPLPGTNSVVLAADSPSLNWTAQANASWLHLSISSTSGTGSTNVIFRYDPNTGATRSNTITIAGLTLTVTQAGSNYVAADDLTALASSPYPACVALDTNDNVYYLDLESQTVSEWKAASNASTTLIYSGTIYGPSGLAVDYAGNVYVADNELAALDKWSPSTRTLTTVVSSNLESPNGLAVDSAGNVYIADNGVDAIWQYNPTTSNLTSLISSGLYGPYDVAVDAADNVYIADETIATVWAWYGGGSLVDLASGANFAPNGVSVDGSGNVDIADINNSIVRQWNAASGTTNILVGSGLYYEQSVAVDPSGNVFIADSGDGAIKEWPNAFVPVAPMLEGSSAGTGSLPPVVPATANLTGPFAPSSDRSWLTITGVSNGVVSFSFPAFNIVGGSRTAHINLLGQSIPVTQSGTSSALGYASRVEGPGPGVDSVILAEAAANTPWTASTLTSWLHLSATSGEGTTNFIFSFDANAGATRSGTIVIDGATLTVTQAGVSYMAVDSLTTLVNNGGDPLSVALDTNDNVYYTDGYYNGVFKWSPLNNTITGIITEGLEAATGVAVDNAGDVYVSDSEAADVYEWKASNASVTMIVSSASLSEPDGLAVDPAGNLYIADGVNDAIYQWNPQTTNLTTSLSGGALVSPYGVAVDAAGRLYIGDAGNGSIDEWLGGQSLAILAAGGYTPIGVAADGAGNVDFADNEVSMIRQWNAVSETVVNVVSSELSYEQGVAVDASGNIYIADSGDGVIKELPNVFVVPAVVQIGSSAGTASLPPVIPATANLTGPFAPSSDQSWLTITGVTNGVVSFSFPAFNSVGGSRTAHINLLGQAIPITQSGPSSGLGYTSRVEGAAGGVDTVVLAMSSANSPWSANTIKSWLHPSVPNGYGSTNFVFSFDANPGLTRSGVIAIGGQTLTVIQAGAGYVPAQPLTTLVYESESFYPSAVAVDGAGDVIIADNIDSAIYTWLQATNTLKTNVTDGLQSPTAVAVDAETNIYCTGTFAGGPSGLYEFPSDSTNVVTLAFGYSYASGLTLDAAGDAYFVNEGENDGVYEWIASNGSVTNVVPMTDDNQPYGVAVDVANNIYISDSGMDAIYETTAFNPDLNNLASTGSYSPNGIAVDGGGNVFIAEPGLNAIQEWMAASQTLVTLPVVGMNFPVDVAVDGAGDLYIADMFNFAVEEIPRAFVDTTLVLESASGGTGSLSPVLPATQNLTGPFTPISSQPWLTITGVSNGVVSYSISPNSGANRTANINMLGQSIPVTQLGSSYTLGTYSRVESSGAGSDSVVLSVQPATGTWSSQANASWLHLSLPNQSGAGSTNIIFSYDANPGATRTGSITIAGQTLSVTQAGTGYVEASHDFALASSGLVAPGGVAVDSSNNVYFADGDSSLYEWSSANNSYFSLATAGMNLPNGVAFGGGSVFVADTYDNEIQVYPLVLQSLVPFISSGLLYPTAVAVDSSTNLYIADAGDDSIKLWPAFGRGLMTLVSTGLRDPEGLTVDAAGNVYVADYGDNAIKELIGRTNLITLVASGLRQPQGVSVDGAGNVFIADTGDEAIKEWVAASNTLITVVSNSLVEPRGVAVDGADDLYLTDTEQKTLYGMPYAFVDPAPILENSFPDTDVLPLVLPTTVNLQAPFTPTTDQPWLSISSFANGFVTFTFSGNTNAASRTGHIFLLGQTISVTQLGPISGPPVRPIGATNMDSLKFQCALAHGAFQLSFSNTPDASFSVLSSTNLSLPLSSWTVMGSATSSVPGQFQFSAPATPNDAVRFYRVRSP